MQAQEIQVSYGDRLVLDQLSCQLEAGKITTIIGANGSGKSTLLKALTRILPLETGQVVLDGQAIAQMNTKEVARKLALLPQVQTVTQGICVYDLISYGRYPHLSTLGRLGSEDREKIAWAMEVTQVAAFQDQLVDSLSGGQRQRVWIAMALAQDTDWIFLDEPTTYLDLNHQLEVLDLLAELNQTQGKSIVMVLHDLNLAARFSHRLLALKEGNIAFAGAASEVMTATVLRSIFAIEAHIVQDPLHGKPVCLSYTRLQE
ncbi:ABC transporter ATP-binding protein [Streptococcus danieliae]|uniref:ABC transporter ATP-binding protein n=1 Tax=Streptococcus danieliae TaxID=747656 RepID=A0A7Z0LE24_9STRE|nr:ABC transporter ATP-binding protein [Streptococcus danieliae]MBF0717722.1 ABC transporter ATP-binding protein [Streptococcus danieliae]NYS49652.1 ABC transporter ATP-binding protein [Streptococcus danieliae]